MQGLGWVMVVGLRFKTGLLARCKIRIRLTGGSYSGILAINMGSRPALRVPVRGKARKTGPLSRALREHAFCQTKPFGWQWKPTTIILLPHNCSNYGMDGKS